MLKIKFKHTLLLNITQAVKGLFLIYIILLISSFNDLKHPFYISVIDLKHDAKQQSLNISIRLFTNDLEDALRKTTKKPVDILNPKNKEYTDSIVCNYILKRLIIQFNSKNQKLNFIGYEKEEESIWAYFEISKCLNPKKITVETKLLYDYLPQEVNIVHVEFKAIKKSFKLTNPENRVEFDF